MFTLHITPGAAFAKPRRIIQAAAFGIGAVLSLIAYAPAHAAFPDKPIKIVIPYPPAAPDSYGRLLADRLSKNLGVPVVVENRPGAGGGIGAQYVARAPADGHTLLFCGGSLFLVNPHVYKNPIYDRTQFVGVAQVAEVPIVFIARKDLAAGNLSELVTLMKKEPGKVRYGNPSLGSQFHMAWEQFTALHQVKDASVMLGANYITPILNGDVDITVLTPGPFMGYFQTGQMKPLAITGPARISKLPQVPTVTELGMPALDNVADYFLMAPKGTPKAVVDRLVLEINAISKDPEYLARLADLYGTPGRATNPADFEKLLDVKSKEWADIVKKSGVSIQ